MKLKLASTLTPAVLESLLELVRPLYTKPGMRIVAICEFAHVKRIEVAPDEDEDPSVTIGLKAIEVGHGEQVDALQKAAHALHVQRTAYGTLDEELGELKLTQSLLEELADNVALRETARLRAALNHIVDRLGRLKSGTFSANDLRKQAAHLHSIALSSLEWRDPADDSLIDLRTASGVKTGDQA